MRIQTSKENLIELRNNLDWIVNKVNNMEVSDSEMYTKLSSILPFLVDARNRLDRMIELNKQYIDIVNITIDDYYAQKAFDEYVAEKRIWSKAFGLRD